jgi:hypothetical protein
LRSWDRGGGQNAITHSIRGDGMFSHSRLLFLDGILSGTSGEISETVVNGWQNDR